jgi:hypothetical protein
MEFYSAVKENEILTFFREMQKIILGEVKQVQNTKSCMVSLICGI